MKLAKKLHDKKGREKEKSFIVEGEKLVSEAIANGATIKNLIFRGSEINDYPIPDGVDAMIFTESVFDSVADTVTPQPLMAIVAIPEYLENISTNSSGNSFRNGYMLLDCIQDPGNVGTIIRTAEAASFKGIIIVKGTADPYSQKVVRSAAGAIFKIPIIMLDNAQEALKYINDNGIRAILCDASGSIKHTDCDLKGNIAFIVGNEGNGLSDYFIKNVDESIAIEMEANSESLNVAIASAILMFEKRRQEDIGD